MSLFNLDNDRGVYTPAAREIYFNQISPQSSSLTSNIQFRIQSNSVQQMVPQQSYFTIKVKIDNVDRFTGTHQTNFLASHLNDYFVHNYFSRVNVSMNGVRVSSLDQPTAYIHAYTDAVTTRDSNESSEGIFNKDAMTVLTGGSKKSEVMIMYRPHLSFFNLPYAMVTGDTVIQLVPKPAANFAEQTFNIADLNAASLGQSSIGGAHASHAEVLYDDDPNLELTGNTARSYSGVATSLDGGANSANNPVFSIEQIDFFVAFATPQLPTPLPPLLKHQLSTPNIQFVPLQNHTSLNTTLTIPSSTYYLQVYCFDNSTAFSRAVGPLRFDVSTINELTMRIAGGVYPSLPYLNLSSTTSSDLSRAYTDSINSRMRLDLDSSYPKSFQEWVIRPVVSHQIYRAQNNTDQTLQIQVRRTNNALTSHQLCVVAYYHEILGMTYEDDQLVRVDVQPVL